MEEKEDGEKKVEKETVEEKEDGEKKVEKETVEEEEVGAANPGLLQTKINPSNV